MQTTNATATIKAIEIGFSTSPLRIPYAIARLDCGHCAAVMLRPYRGECNGCGKTVELVQSAATKCECGGLSFRVIFSPNPHRVEDRITKVGDAVACEQCAIDNKRMEWMRSIEPETVMHARHRDHRYDLYRRDASSPSGRILMGSVPDSAESELRRMGICMLSPTELLGC